MQDDDAFLSSIPPFLRRFVEAPPRKLPIRPRDLPEAQGQTAQQSKPAAAQVAAPAAPAALAAPVLTPAPKMVELAQPAAVEAPAAQQARIALAFENQDMGEGSTGGAAHGPDSEDIAFQVTLPRGVVRQIRMLAAEKDTTQRAVMLRALRLAGLSVPEGSDIDRRGRSAKRQSQA